MARYNSVLILSAMAAGARYGLEVIERTGLSSGTIYPALRRMEAQGMVEADWEPEDEAHREGRPARRYYRVTPEGHRALKKGLAELHERQRALGWPARG